VTPTTPIRVSAIIPTYNRADYVVRSIDSALVQRLANGQVQVIVVDDGSTDDTAAVVQQRFGTRVRYLAQQNRREGAARNTGAADARGGYLAFLDSDDYWLPGKLEADVARLERPDRPALVYSRVRNVDPDDRPLGERRLPSPQGDVFWALARESFVPMSSVTVRADAFRACGGFREDRALSGTADWELWLRMAARWPVGFVAGTRTCIRVHPRNMLSDSGYMERAMLAGVRHGLADAAVARRVGQRAGEVRSHMYVTIALNAYASGRSGRSWSWLLAAVRAWPPQVADRRFWGATARVALSAQREQRQSPKQVELR